MVRVARKMRIQLEDVELEAIGTIDQRGRAGTAPVQPHFLKVELWTRVKCDASEERFQRLAELVDRHCPTLNLMKAAEGTEVVVHWERKQEDD